MDESHYSLPVHSGQLGQHLLILKRKSYQMLLETIVPLPATAGCCVKPPSPLSVSSLHVANTNSRDLMYAKRAKVIRPGPFVFYYSNKIIILNKNKSNPDNCHLHTNYQMILSP